MICSKVEGRGSKENSLGERERERELSQAALEYKEIVQLIETVGLMKTITNIGRCYEKLVREFIVNISKECTEEERKE
jgi:hypothetical protein